MDISTIVVLAVVVIGFVCAILASSRKKGQGHSQRPTRPHPPAPPDSPAAPALRKRVPRDLVIDAQAEEEPDLKYRHAA